MEPIGWRTNLEPQVTKPIQVTTPCRILPSRTATLAELQGSSSSSSFDAIVIPSPHLALLSSPSLLLLPSSSFLLFNY